MAASHIGLSSFSNGIANPSLDLRRLQAIKGRHPDCTLLEPVQEVVEGLALVLKGDFGRGGMRTAPEPLC